MALELERVLGDEWVNDAGKWVNRIKSNPNKVVRVFNDVMATMKEGKLLTTPAGLAEDNWKRFY